MAMLTGAIRVIRLDDAPTEDIEDGTCLITGVVDESMLMTAGTDREGLGIAAD
jgi:hypothetical protein